MLVSQALFAVGGARGRKICLPGFHEHSQECMKFKPDWVVQI